jgi:hypothetical protein
MADKLFFLQRSPDLLCCRLVPRPSFTTIELLLFLSVLPPNFLFPAAHMVVILSQHGGALFLAPLLVVRVTRRPRSCFTRGCKAASNASVLAFRLCMLLSAIFCILLPDWPRWPNVPCLWALLHGTGTLQLLPPCRTAAARGESSVWISRTKAVCFVQRTGRQFIVQHCTLVPPVIQVLGRPGSCSRVRSSSICGAVWSNVSLAWCCSHSASR